MSADPCAASTPGAPLWFDVQPGRQRRPFFALLNWLPILLSLLRPPIVLLCMADSVGGNTLFSACFALVAEFSLLPQFS
jgi:hypothetical protein